MYMCPSCCAPPACGTICASVTGCGGAALTGATVTVTTKHIVSIPVTNGGTSYVSPPTVNLSTTNGRGGTAVSVLVGGVVDHIDVTNGGNYVGAVTVSFSGGGGSGATAGPAVLSADDTVGTCTTTGQITSASVTAPGSGYNTIPTASASGGGGSGATFSVAMQYDAFPIASGGTGYANGQILTVVGGTSSTAAVINVTAVSGGVITAVSVNDRGIYTALPTSPVSVTGGTGTGATFNLTWRVVRVTPITNGAGYTSAPTIAFSSGSATATATRTVRCCVGVTGAGAYTVTGSMTGFSNTTSTSTFVTCTGTNSPTLALGTPTGMICICSTTGKPCENIPIPQTLNASDGIGSLTVTNLGGEWTGCVNRSGSGMDATCTNPETSNVAVQFGLSCGTGPNSWGCSMSTTGCPTTAPTLLRSGNSCASIGLANVIQSSLAGTASSCSPFSLTLSVTIAPTNPLFLIYGGSATLTFTS